ncbi:nuclear transport factor 2 family protein [Gordonia sp. ABSL1-1]|uniref:nuclear transport factor 2 family protein n=1 Tax=Gordonia sp. ABSL1-1 TaxID=3053923 RepID=UPI0025726D1F|nr:nuclear transport factor 2 family protein [Gordonia sp. ABSL1-1]MDL9937213.1 nuclear transport factor 2 family protein [Gordonia sp. ABSL1-1]
MFDETKFQEALTLPRLQQPIPEFLPGNRAGGQVRTMNEAELTAMTAQWFVDYEKKIEFYADHGFDIGWTLEWAKKYWWSWMMRDMSLNHELYTPDLRYKDPTTFGRVIVGHEEFVAYNFAFLDAITDWRYDPLPGQVYIDMSPDGELRMCIRYVGTGHFGGSLRFYPYDDSAPTLHGNGTFVQCTAVDRYHFTPDGLMYEGETLFDLLDATQSAGILPGDNSLLFKSLIGASKIPAAIHRLRSRF